MNKTVSVPLRIPQELRDFLLADAKLNRRSMNSHMLALLEERKRNLSLNEKALGAVTPKALDANPNSSI